MNWARNCIIISALSLYSAVSQAQTGKLPDFFEKHFRVEAVKEHSGPKVSTQFDYKIFDSFVANSHVKLNKEGVEDRMALGFVQDFGPTSARISYNMHRIDYQDRVDENDDISLELSYRSLRLQHRINNSTQVSQINLPFDLFAATLDLSFSQTLDVQGNEAVDVYQVSSQSKYMKIAAAWKYAHDTTATDFATEYRPTRNWLMKLSYSDDGVALQRQIRSEYTAHNYRVAGEYQFHTAAGDKDTIKGIISIEKDTDYAALKLRLEYNDAAAASALFFELASKNIF